jgi:hypothetical protein
MDPPPRRENFVCEAADVSYGCEVTSPAKKIIEYDLTGVDGRWLFPRSVRKEGHTAKRHTKRSRLD